MSVQFYVVCLILFMYALYFGRSAWIAFFPKKKKQRWRMAKKEVIYLKGFKCNYISFAYEYESSNHYNIGDKCAYKGVVWERVG